MKNLTASDIVRAVRRKLAQRPTTSPRHLDLPALRCPEGWRETLVRPFQTFVGPGDLRIYVTDMTVEEMRIRAVMLCRGDDMPSPEDVAFARPLVFGDVRVLVDLFADRKHAGIFLIYSPDWGRKLVDAIGSSAEEISSRIQTFRATRADPRRGGLKVELPEGWQVSSTPSGLPVYVKDGVDVIVTDEMLAERAEFRFASITNKRGSKLLHEELEALERIFLPPSSCAGTATVERTEAPGITERIFLICGKHLVDDPREFRGSGVSRWEN